MESPDDLVTPIDDSTALVSGFRFVSMIADDGREPPSGTTDLEASGSWSAGSCPWHPALLAIAAELPRFEDVAIPTNPEPGEVRLVASGQLGHLPPGYLDLARAAGVPVVEATDDRLATVRVVLEQVENDLKSTTVPDLDDSLAIDYLALGSCHWWIRDLTIAMGHVDTLARPALLREAKAGGQAWAQGDRTAAENHLRASFELLTEARERFYPMDGYVIDFCLLDPTTPPEGLGPLLDSGKPFTLVAPAQAIERFAEARPDLASRLRDAIAGGWADVVGGSWSEADEPFLPWSTIAWQFTQGELCYRRHLDDRNVETLARRRFGLYPQLPQVARRFGLRYAWLIALDAGRFPLVPESKRQWAAPDGTTLESITRPPVAADRPVEAARLAWRIAKSMKDDQVATLPLAHWPSPIAAWFDDFRRSTRFTSVLGRWVTANDYFHYSDRPFEEITLKIDDLATTYLVQAVARKDPSPIGSRATHARLRARFDALSAAHALSSALAGDLGITLDPDLESRIETEPSATLEHDLERRLQDQADQLARSIVGTDHGGESQPGYLVLNLLGVPRRVTVPFSGGSPSPNAGKALKAIQSSPVGTVGTVELAPFGFAWFAEDSRLEASPVSPSGTVIVRGQTISHESIVVSIDPSTGGIRGINAVGEESPRIGQQIVIGGLVGDDGKPAPSRMRATSVQVEASGPALARITSRGTLHDPRDDRPLASFAQEVEVASGRPGLSIRIQLDHIDPSWLERVADTDPWVHYLACRWAWADPQSTLRRTVLLSLFPTESERPETPDAIDITSRQRRTTLLFGGLSHHRRHGARMLDTILVAGRETSRTFQFGVTLNLEHAFPSILDFTIPALVARTPNGPPSSGPVGWLIQVDNKSVALVRLIFVPSTNEGRGWGVIADVIETSGRAARCRIKAFRDPIHARQVNGHGDHVVDLQFDRDGASVDLTPYEIARVELTFGGTSNSDPEVEFADPYQ